MTIATQNQINSIEDSINTLSRKKDELVLRKREVEAENSEIKNKIRTGGLMSNNEYQKLCNKQNMLRREMVEIERGVLDINHEIRSKSSLTNQLKQDRKETNINETKDNLVALKNEYIRFAADKSRVGSMRAMAAEFAEKLEQIIVTI